MRQTSSEHTVVEPAGIAMVLERRVSIPPPRLTQRVREVMSMFGLHARGERAVSGCSGGAGNGGERIIIPRTRITLPIPGPGIVLITGPSGAGKSTLLALIAAELARSRAGERHRVIAMRRFMRSAEQACDGQAGAGAADEGADGGAGGDAASRDACVIDLVAPRRPLSEALHALSIAGLADAFVMLRRPEQLSDGQRARFEIARAIAASDATAGPAPCVILLDEFAATLDRLTATTLARSLRRWSDRSGATFILATSHDDLVAALSPDVRIITALDGHVQVIARARVEDSEIRPAQPAAPSTIQRHEPIFTNRSACEQDCGPRAALDHVVIEPGTPADYLALATFHYRSHRAGAVKRVWRLVAPQRAGGELAGVLVLSLSALSCSLRDVATRGRYAHLTPRERGIVLNREVRCISRVILEPRFRGLGLAVKLVKHALAHPEAGVAYIEALAAMGRINPFFERAGMRRYELPPRSRPAHARLLDALDAAGLEVDDLDADRSAWSALECGERAWLVTELRGFLRATARCDRQSLDAMTEREMLSAARPRLAPPPLYYLHAIGRDPSEGEHEFRCEGEKRACS